MKSTKLATERWLKEGWQMVKEADAGVTWKEAAVIVISTIVGVLGLWGFLWWGWFPCK